MARLYLSPPHLSGEERVLLEDALESNWIAPLGPHVDAFEGELAEAAEVPHVAALSSGTAALHLALHLCGVERGDAVLCPSLTFVATANAVAYLGAEPVFLDSSEQTWTLCPHLLREEIEARARTGKLPKAVVTVDLYGQSADYDPIVAVCEEYGVALVEDAAEGLGADYRGRPLGGFGRFGVFSFNGNKIITTSGGGALLSSDGKAIERARNLASQARDPAPHYQHSSLGFNYRLSNLLAAVGRAQLRVLGERVEARRRVFESYQRLLGGLPGIEFMPEARYGRASRWLTCLTLDPERFGANREQIRLALEAEDIEARPIWKPLHLQPLFDGAAMRGGQVAERLFERGLCLPSGSAMAEADVERVSRIVEGTGAKQPR